ncbi:polcalcin Phl p 7-like [Gastrolobium bilobum]|uniref:polcalcin Phl p 7-like n=1 Tax=Gastrolobium bilobum TaxID=150636 RepID=UPI002AB23D80|nr:polcalcin Phl p 7-like [Gastrolobium bilobum]
MTSLVFGLRCLGGCSTVYYDGKLGDDVHLQDLRGTKIIKKFKGTMANRAECERVFRRFDVNGDGKISLSELADALKVLGLTSQEEVQLRMAEIDKDGDGFITLEELIEFQKNNTSLMAEVLKKL